MCEKQTRTGFGIKIVPISKLRLDATSLQELTDLVLDGVDPFYCHAIIGAREE